MVRTHGESTGNWIKPNMDLMNKVGRLRYAHQWTSGIDILHPPVYFLVRPECKVYQFLLRFQLHAEGLEVDSLNIDDISQVADEGGGG